MKWTSSSCRRGRAAWRLPAVSLLLVTLLLAAPARGQQWKTEWQGVTSSEILLGVTSPFKGHAASLGTELYRGYMAYFQKINEEGGVNGRRIRLVLYDDGYEPSRAVKNTIRLITEDKVFLLFGNVGTPTTVRTLPLLKKFEDRRIFLFAPFTGAQTQREDPYDQFVYNVRASYRQEIAGLVDMLIDGGYRKIAILYQSDAYGRSGQDGLLRALGQNDLTPAAEATYARGTRFDSSMERQVEILMEGGAEAIISVGSYDPCAAFIRDARDAGFKGPIANISFVGAGAMLQRLKTYGLEVGRDYSSGLINSQVVPHYGDTVLPGVQEYRRLMERYSPLPPEELRDGNYTPPAYSFGSLEGFINAKVLVSALRSMGDSANPLVFRRAMASMSSFDAGIDTSIEFGPDDHQGMDKVYFTTVDRGEWIPLRNISDIPLP